MAATPPACFDGQRQAGSIRQNVDGWTRTIEFLPGYDHVGQPCGHGRHGMELRFLVANEEGATVLLLFASDWLPGSLDLLGQTERGRTLHGVMAADLGHHWTRPVYPGEIGGQERCQYLHGAPCFYDGSGLNAGPVAERFFAEGLDAVWDELERYHHICRESAASAAAEVR